MDIEKYYIDNEKLKTVTIELINNCNFKCKHCYLDSQNIKLNRDKVFDIIDRIRDMGAHEIKLTGGEITLRKDLAKIIEYARRKYMNVSLLTNLYIMNDDLFNVIDYYGIDRVEVTMFSNEEHIHDSFVGKIGAFKKTINNIKRLIRINIKVRIKTWAINSNINQLDEMKDYFKNMGCEFYIFNQIYKDVNGNEKLAIEEKLSKEMYIKSLYCSDVSQNRDIPVVHNLDDKLCCEFSNSTYIASNGDVYPCAKYRKPIGNIYIDEINKIWESYEYRKIRNLRWKDLKECLKCKDEKYCIRCGAMSFINGFDYLDNSFETCLHARLRREIYK